MKKKEITLQEHMSRIARIKSEKKAAASRANGAKSKGRPKKEVDRA